MAAKKQTQNSNDICADNELSEYDRDKIECVISGWMREHYDDTYFCALTQKPKRLVVTYIFDPSTIWTKPQPRSIALSESVWTLQKKQIGGFKSMVQFMKEYNDKKLSSN